MALAMVGGIFGINGDGKLSCMDKVMGFGFSGRTRKQRRRSAGAEYFARRSCWGTPAGQDDEAVCAQVGCAVKLIIAGLHEDALREMDDRDRCQALEQAGLDPEEFEYLAV